MSFKNPSAGLNKIEQIMNTIDVLTENVKSNNLMTEEALAILRDINAQMNINRANSNSKQVAENNDEEKDKITFFSDTQIPSVVEASAGMQRVLVLSEEQIKKINETKQKVNEDVISIDLSEEESIESTENVIPLKL